MSGQERKQERRQDHEQGEILDVAYVVQLSDGSTQPVYKKRDARGEWVIAGRGPITPPSQSTDAPEGEGK